MKKEVSDLTPEQRQEIAALAALPDAQIDTTDAPETADWSQGKRGVFYRAGNQHIADTAYAEGGAGKTETREYGLRRGA